MAKNRWKRATAPLLAIVALGLLGSPAAASGPKLTVPKAERDAAFECPIDPTGAT